MTSDPFIVYTSNIFAILGLRSLYFLLAHVVHRFHYLKYGLAVILTFVGVKMLIEAWYTIPIFVSLAVIVGVLALSVVFSLLRPQSAMQVPKGEFEGKTSSLFGRLPSRPAEGSSSPE